MEKIPISGYDDTKRMLNTIRKLNENRTSYKILKEELEPEQSGIDAESMKQDNVNVLVINNTDVKLVSTDTADLELSEEQKSSISKLIDSFLNEVSQIADLKPGITINETQIRLDGSIPDVDVSFIFISGDESGLYINADMLTIDDETLFELSKLLKFESTFQTTIEPMLRERKTN